MASELTPQEQKDRLLAAMEAAVARTNPRLVEPSMSQHAPAFTQARQSYLQYGQVPFKNQVVNPKLLLQLAPDTSVSNSTMPQAELPQESFDAFGGDVPDAVLSPEAPAAPTYLPDDTPANMLVESVEPPPDLTLQENAPLQARDITAPQVGMAPQYADGIKDRRGTLNDLQLLLKAGEIPINQQEDAYTTRMGQYATDLGTLQGAREKLDNARGVERQVESADMARTAMRFDANRIFSDVASSPLGTAGLAIASGIVQGLNGYAGQDKPDAILAAIKEAATRDVGNQVKMAEAGEKSRLGSKNAYDEAIKSGADKQEAVKLAAMASLDQIGKGLDFMKARQVRAKDRADLDMASGQLKSELGKTYTDMAIKNAEMRLQAETANLSSSTHLQVANATARREFMQMAHAAQEKAAQTVGAYMMNADTGGAALKNLANSQNFYTELKKGMDKGQRLEDLVPQTTLDTLRKNLLAVNSTAEKSVLSKTFDIEAAKIIAATQSPEKRAVMSSIMTAYADHLRSLLGKSQTTVELAQQALVVDLTYTDSVMKFMRKNVSDAYDQYTTQIRITPQNKAVWYAALGSHIALAQELERNLSDGVKNAAVVKEQK